MARPFFPLATLSILGLFAFGCADSLPMAPTQQRLVPEKVMKETVSELCVREPAVAGLFYEAGGKRLSKEVDRYLNQISPRTLPNVRALICPHAGYAFSGPVAAHAYRLVRDCKIETVVVLAPSHYARFDGACIDVGDGFRTPLGLIEIAPEARKMADAPPFIVEEATFMRPQWWRSSSKKPPEAEEETPHTWEHSLEVQLPFLQRVLGKFNLVPIVMGNVDPEAVAEALTPILNDKTLIVASTDLSHYYSYQEANRKDGKACDAILALDAKQFVKEEACGSGPVRVVMDLAKRQGWKPELLDYRNSGDTEGNKSQVVGYAAIAFFVPETESEKTEVNAMEEQEHGPGKYDESNRRLLLDLARHTVVDVVEAGNYPKIDPETIPSGLKEDRGCFVTLKQNGKLRGCIGSIVATEPLWMSVMHMARAAALEDTRFSPVRSDELGDLRVEISVLTPARKLQYDSIEDLLDKLRPGIDGVILKSGWRRATFLPQVWEQLPDKPQFLDHLCQKAGITRDAWRQGELEVEVYQVEAFSE